MPRTGGHRPPLQALSCFPYGIYLKHKQHRSADTYQNRAENYHVRILLYFVYAVIIHNLMYNKQDKLRGKVLIYSAESENMTGIRLQLCFILHNSYYRYITGVLISTLSTHLSTLLTPKNSQKPVLQRSYPYSIHKMRINL